MIIYLYVKQHTITGLRYFGKTVKNPFTYMGSGKYWLRHIKQHDRSFVRTLEVWGFDDQTLCTQFANEFSVSNNIVHSAEWANLVVEDGINNPPCSRGRKRRRESIEASRVKRTGAKRSDAFRERMREIKTGLVVGPASAERRQKMSQARVGKQWFTNVERTQQVLCFAGREPHGWIPGTKIRKRPTPGLKRPGRSK